MSRSLAIVLGQALAAPMAMLPPATPCRQPVSPTLRPCHGHKRGMIRDDDIRDALLATL